MNKVNARFCAGCKAICSKGCCFDFPVRKAKIGEGMETRIIRIPLKPCFKVSTDKGFREVAEYLESREAAHAV